MLTSPSRQATILSNNLRPVVVLAVYRMAGLDVLQKMELQHQMGKARPEFDRMLKWGVEKEDKFYKDVNGAIENKTDKIWHKTGNVFIEIEDAGKPSGLMKTKAKYYIIGLYHPERTCETYIMIKVSLLKKIVKDFPVVKGGDNMEARGHLVPDKALMNYTYSDFSDE